MRRYAHSTRIRFVLVGSNAGNCGGVADLPIQGRRTWRTAPRFKFCRRSQKIDNGAVVPVIPHREENVMAIVVALDYNLVRVASQHCASPPALAPVHLIAETDGELAQINLPFEGIELAIPIH